MKCKATPHVDNEFIVGMPDNLIGSSTHPDSIESINPSDQSVACTVASQSLKTKQQTLDIFTAAFQSIATMLATKEAREAREDLKRGCLEQMRMEEISPCTKKKIKGKLLADYGIVSTPTPPKQRLTTACKSLSCVPGDVSALTLHSSPSDDGGGGVDENDSNDDLFNLYN
jgi:hypothetical protein